MKTTPRGHGGGRIAGMARAAILRLKEIDIPATGDVE
jgi:hypothetical protein